MVLLVNSYLVNSDSVKEKPTAEDNLQQRLETGVGFTMALFIDGLAFGGSPLLDTAKIGILAASIISGVVGYIILRRTPLTAEGESVPAG